MDILFKNNSFSFKDADLKKGLISGYASVFNNIDSDNDTIVKGAFTKTIKENNDRIAVLYQHDIRQPVGKNISLVEDSYGLKFEAQLSNSQLGRDVAIMVDEGIISETSVGFQTIKGQSKENHYEIQEVKLYEYSLVTLAANPLALITGIKSELEQHEEITKRLTSLENFMRKGSVSDESFKLIEFEIKRIKDLQSLKFNEPLLHSDNEEPISFSMEKFQSYLTS